MVTLGLLPPMAPGRMEPVSLYRARILETQPWLTLEFGEMFNDYDGKYFC